MADIQRCEPVNGFDEAIMEPCKNGNWVMYCNHKRIVDELKKECARLQGVICRECKW